MLSQSLRHRLSDQENEVRPVGERRHAPIVLPAACRQFGRTDNKRKVRPAGRRRGRTLNSRQPVDQAMGDASRFRVIRLVHALAQLLEIRPR